MAEAAQLTRSAIDNGNLLLAYDIAVSAMEAGDESVELRHLMVLALARMGDGEQAMELYKGYGLDTSPNPHHRAISARILKDSALETDDAAARREALLAASRAYKRIYSESGDAYPGINAATLAFLAGHEDESRQIAESILSQSEIAEPASYYSAATRAEALLICGKIGEAAAAIGRACELPGVNSGAKAGSSAQLSLVAKAAGLDDAACRELLECILPPSVMHYCGHIFRENDAAETRLRGEVEAFMERENVGFAYGALAAGADILIAEAALARGAELHVTLPFLKSDFITQSVTLAGGKWLERFEACLEAATSVSYATEMNYVGDPAQFGYGTKVAMGMARLRSQFIGTEVSQLAIWDGQDTDSAAGTAADIKAWKGYGGTSFVIEAGDLDRDLKWVRPPYDDENIRRVAAIIFTDFPGFSKLPEASLPTFWNGIMGRMANVLAKCGDHVLARNSWGDALLAFTSSAPSAAQLAMDLQADLREFDYNLLGMTKSGGMRIGVHYGPAYQVIDPITGKTTFYGTEVSRAARIEPVTPEGAVCVTEPFAAILQLEAPDRFSCRYLGRIEFAKGYGTYAIYRLTER